MSNPNKPAYPVIHADANYERMANHGGLTKREMFAMAAMQGILAFSHDENVPTKQNVEYCAKMAVVAADELLKQLGE